MNNEQKVQINREPILIFAGTVDGRRLAEALAEEELQVYVQVATEYGASLYKQKEHLKVFANRLASQDMLKLMLELKPALVVDATHPYAVEVTQNIRQASSEAGIDYIRIGRSQVFSAKSEASVVYVDSIEEAVTYLKKTSGSIFVTTGSKELHKFCKLQDYRNRVFARVLSTPEVLVECGKIGLEGKHILAMQGPFSYEMNVAMLRHVQASYMVTKDSGAVGGALEKYEAAMDLGVKMVVVGRPKGDEGLSYKACLHRIREQFRLERTRNITIVGIGMGTRQSMTLACIEACEKAELLIGAKRMIEAVKEACSVDLYTFDAYKPEDICQYIGSKPEFTKVVVVLSGDSGFYSGAKSLLNELEKRKIVQEGKAKVLPGISSVSYFMSKIQRSYDDVALMSMHGRDHQILEQLKRCGKVFTIVGNQQDVRNICGQLVEFQLGNTKVWIGQELSYAKERIFQGEAKDFVDYEGVSLSVLYLECPNFVKPCVTPGIADGEFQRGKVPMTKEEVRSISLCKLQLSADSVLYDIGAGTGSVSIEAARLLTNGRVYAIEKKPEAVSLLLQNRQKFCASNMKIVEGVAPEVLEELEVPTHSFIGGSSGDLQEIVECLYDKNPDIKLVINAITLETVEDAMACMKWLKERGRKTDVVCVNVAKSEEIGHYHMMIGHNPVYIFTVL